MIYPTEMTLATGTTVYAGDPESDECIASREVRVSVTYRIEEEADFDLADFAQAKAADVEWARIAAQNRIEDRIEKRIGRDRTATCEAAFIPSKESFSPNGEAFDPNDPTLDPPDEDGVAPDPFPEEAEYMNARCSPVANGGCPGNGEYYKNGEHHQNGTDRNGTHARSGLPAFTHTSPGGPERVTQEETDWATKPQVLAVQSHFRRLGLSPENQTALLRARFGKFRPERLTREEAAGLMRCLERGEWESAEPAALAHR